MRVILVGSREERARMRASLNGSIRVVAEFPSLTAAEAAGTAADGILLAPAVRVKPDGTQVRLKPDVREVRLKPDTTYDEDPYDDAPRAAALVGGALPEPLTPREIQVLELLAEGLPNKAIAERLGISDQTVKFHVASISGKLGAANRTDAVRRAVRRGLITL
jgi:DNA-binding CsgD family transcriptional regulator